MAKDWIETMHKGGLHETTHTPQGQKIPAAKMAAAAAGRFGSKGRKQAQAAKNMEGLHRPGRKGVFGG